MTRDNVRDEMSAAVYCQGGSGEMKGCTISAPGLEARGVILEQGAIVSLDKCHLHHTWNSALWSRARSKATLSSCDFRKFLKNISIQSAGKSFIIIHILEDLL